jgi:hypothetical protein
MPAADELSEGGGKGLRATPKAQKKLLKALRPIAAGVVAGVSVPEVDDDP